MKRLACGYDRVSTMTQAERTDVRRRYIPAIKAKCRERGWKLTEIYSDAGISGQKDKRPGAMAAVEWAKANRGVIVFYDLSRFSRTIRWTVNTAFDLKNAGASICSCIDPIDTTDNSPAGELCLHIWASIAQFYARQNGYKVKVSNDATVAELGYRTQGEQPAGWMLQGKLRVPCEPELEVIRRCKRLVREGLSYRKAAQRLTAEGVPTIAQLRNRPVNWAWTGAKVRKLAQKTKLPSRAPAR